MSTFGVAQLGDGGQGVVDHRLARRHLIAEFHRGRLGHDQVCDAHPELLRAARNVGTATGAPCPICRAGDLRWVTYVFGPRLPAGGRVLSAPGELARLRARPNELTAYVVEACIECRWHHLLSVIPVGRLRRRNAS